MAFQLTARGEAEAVKVNRPMGPETTVIAFLYREGRPTEAEDIMEETRMGEEKATRVLKRLINLGYVEEV